MRWSASDVHRLRILPGHTRSLSGAEIRFVYVAAGSPTLEALEADDLTAGAAGLTEALSLQSGDVVLLTRGGEHRVRTGSHDEARLVTGALTLDTAPFERVTELMPAVLFSCGFRIHDSAYGGLIDLIEVEMSGERPGRSAVVSRLIDVVVSATLRSWLESGCVKALTWMAELRDPHLGRALAAIHSDPGSPWTVESLARLAMASRSQFAERFRTIVGESPGRYLTKVRMRRAEELLLAGRPVSHVAFDLGYDSDEGFRRAFQRHYGSAPTSWRRAMERATA
jgi:AraC-like DNA-binding protein